MTSAKGGKELSGKDKVKRSLSPDNLELLSKDELVSRLIEMKVYVEELENRSNCSESRSEDSRLRQHQTESQRRENVLFMRLTAKEQEVQEFLSQLEELRTSLGGGLRNALLDPVVNSIFQKMREELKQTKEKMEQSQDELNAWKFTPDSTTGKRLMAKCKSLIQENEELGKMMEEGKLAELEGELKLSKRQTEELIEGQSEVDEFLVELDEDMEGLQATVVYLQKELEAARQENHRLRELLGQERPPISRQDASSRTSARSATPSMDEPPILTGEHARRTAAAVRKHEPRPGKHRTAVLTFIDESPDWTGTSPVNETEVVQNGSGEDRDARTPTEEEVEQAQTPVSPPPRKMPKLDNSSVGHYSPRSPEVPNLGIDSNLEQEEEEDGETTQTENSMASDGHGAECCARDGRTRKSEGLGLFEKFSVTQNGIVADGNEMDA